MVESRLVPGLAFAAPGKAAQPREAYWLEPRPGRAWAMCMTNIMANVLARWRVAGKVLRQTDVPGSVQRTQGEATLTSLTLVGCVRLRDCGTAGPRRQASPARSRRAMRLAEALQPAGPGGENGAQGGGGDGYGRSFMGAKCGVHPRPDPGPG